ncbi:MAG: phosphogluconate dehydratase [Myxococcota bacterium]
MPNLHPTLVDVAARVRQRSEPSRAAYLDKLNRMRDMGPPRPRLGCGNLAHAFAACGDHAKAEMARDATCNIGIVTAYNDMLSAHQPYHRMLDPLKAAVVDAGGVAQTAGGVPAMCDGVTQGQIGMELSLFSRDVIAMSTAIALSHDVFDGGLLLGVCDKIVPGLLIGALSFGHLPFVFVPAGPMPTGISNSEKQAVRQEFAKGKVGRLQLLESEARAYHSPGTCTFYGTANSNQMMLEMMGLQLIGSSFVQPQENLREHLNAAAAQRAVALSQVPFTERKGIGDMVGVETVLNAVIGLLATGGSTNHTIHLLAIGRAAGVELTWEDFADLSRVVPLLARVYPNGKADVNAFHAAGGVPYVMKELIDGGLLFDDIETIGGRGLRPQCVLPTLGEGEIAWETLSEEPHDDEVLRPRARPFQPTGGLEHLRGPLGEGVIKVSAVKPEHLQISAPAVVFDDQDDLLHACKSGELERDFVAVVRFQGPSANGMPELHKLTPSLGVLLDKGYKVALVTDGRMSGASGKVPAAIHMSPEAIRGGPLARVRTGDIITLDAREGLLTVDADLSAREPAPPPPRPPSMGRELFASMRAVVGSADAGASVFGSDVLEVKA